MNRTIPLSLRISGDGVPIVFIHGWGMSGTAWRFQTPLSVRFRLLCPDLPGYGDSVPLPDGMEWSASVLARLLADTLVRHVDEPVILVGWSLGSLVALRFATDFPHLTRGLALVGATSRFCIDDGYDAGLPPKELRGLAARLKRRYGETMGEFFSMMFAQQELDTDQYRKIVREIILPGRQPSLGVALKGLELLATEDLRGELSKVSHPTLLIHGLADTIVPPSSARFLADNLPHASLQYLPGIGHAPFLSRPEEFNLFLSTFVEEVAP